ncbi:MAG: hypothetical protein ABUT20_55640 [Bacteroidota bacterium]
MMKFILFLLSFFTAFNISAQRKAKEIDKIEIYLLKEPVQENGRHPGTLYFLPSKNDISNEAFIDDNEILGYFIYQDTLRGVPDSFYSIRLSQSAKEKINNLKNIPLCCGLKFAIVVNGTPVFGAYFWNFASSFGCDWINVPARAAEDQIFLMKGLPSSYFNNTKADPRGNKDLLDAFAVTKRLFNL